MSHSAVDLLKQYASLLSEAPAQGQMDPAVANQVAAQASPQPAAAGLSGALKQANPGADPVALLKKQLDTVTQHMSDNIGHFMQVEKQTTATIDQMEEQMANLTQRLYAIEQGAQQAAPAAAPATTPAPAPAQGQA